MPEPFCKRQSPSIPPILTHEANREDAVDRPPKLEDLDDVRPPPETPSVKTEPSPPPPLRREKSESSTPAPTNGKLKRPGPQLIGDLPLAEKEAKATFIELPENHYQYNTLGRSREALESMTCDCVYDHGVDDPSDACGQSSDCINRLTQVECLPDDCRCRAHCQNQRFQRKEYANIEIVLTEKKGYGLRAASDVPKDGFIYEYIGDVVSHPSFMKRMREYADEGIKHFYFMMLQKDEYIDATKRGGIGRFANHSCSPNCYVAKWQVGERVRMGIFANRFIKKDEELTFNYNVDRYGHEPQLCYCGESNCVGFLGGKTQTDIGGMDDLYLEALGIIDEVEKQELKGTKRKKSKKLDEDYLPELKPLVEKDIPKVVQAMRQTQSKKLLSKFLTRIKITENEAALRQIMRLRGFSLMTNILQDHAKDVEITILALEAMVKWPLIQRNKVDDSKIRVPVQVCAESENEGMKSLALKLLEYWDSLEVAYRIPKRLKANGQEEISESPSIIVIQSHDDSRPLKKTRWEGDDIEFKPAAPTAPQPGTYIPLPYHQEGQMGPTKVHVHRAKKREIADVIAAANAAAAEAEAARLAAISAATELPPEVVKKKPKAARKSQTKEEKEANKEKRLLKLIGAVVVRCMSKYSSKMGTDMFKKYAKELTHVITEKEKKSSSYREGRLEALPDEKIAKIKKFAKEYIAKVLRKLEKSKSRHGSASDKPSSSSSSHHRSRDLDRSGREPPGSVTSEFLDTRQDGDDGDGGDVEMVMSVEQAMDLGSDSEDGDHDPGPGDEDDAEMDMDMQQSSDEMEHDPSPTEDVSSHVTPITPPPQQQTLDPRLKHRSEELGWDPDAIRMTNGLNEVHV